MWWRVMTCVERVPHVEARKILVIEFLELFVRKIINTVCICSECSRPVKLASHPPPHFFDLVAKMVGPVRRLLL